MLKDCQRDFERSEGEDGVGVKKLKVKSRVLSRGYWGVGLERDEMDYLRGYFFVRRAAMFLILSVIW